MFCSVTKSVNKEVEVETVCESAQLAQSVHLAKAFSPIFHFFFIFLFLFHFHISHRQLLQV